MASPKDYVLVANEFGLHVNGIVDDLDATLMPWWPTKDLRTLNMTNICMSTLDDGSIVCTLVDDTEGVSEVFEDVYKMCTYL